MLKKKLKKIFKLIHLTITVKGNQMLRQITFTTGRMRWGWTPPQFQNAVINP